MLFSGACLPLTAPLVMANQTQSLDKVVVVATKTENNLSQLPSNVILIEQAQIENSGAANLADILKNTAGIYSAPNGSDLSIRGFGTSDILFLIDGKRVNGEFQKSFEAERISAGMIERIEILKGPSSVLYGADALGGVINIITKKAKDDFSGNIAISAGNRKKTADLFLSGQKNDTQVKFYANLQKQDAYSEKKQANPLVSNNPPSQGPAPLRGLEDSYQAENDYLSDIETKNIGLGIRHKVNNELEASFDISYLVEEKSGRYISGVYSSNVTNNNGNKIPVQNIPAEEFNENTRLDISAGLNYDLSAQTQINYLLSYSKYDKDRKVFTPLWSELRYQSEKDSLSSENESTLTYLNNELFVTHTMDENNRFSAGAEHRINKAESTAFDDVDDRTVSSAYAQHEAKINDELNLIYGVRYDKNSIGDAATSLSAGGTFALTENTKLKANFSQGFRSPDNRDLYVDQTAPNGMAMLGSTIIKGEKTTGKELKAETSDTIELGMISQGKNWLFDAAIYKTTIDDRISRVTVITNPQPRRGYMTFDNIADSEIKGFEASLQLGLTDNLNTTMNFSRTDAQNLTEDSQLQYIPEQLASLGLNYFPTENIEVSAYANYTGEQLGAEGKIKGFTIVNLKTQINDVVPDLDLFAGVDNVTGAQPDEELGLIPEAYFYAGLNYHF